MTGFWVTMATHSGCYIMKVFACLIEVERVILIGAAPWVKVVASWWIRKREAIWKSSLCFLCVTSCLMCLQSSPLPFLQTEANQTQCDQKLNTRWLCFRQMGKAKPISEFMNSGVRERWSGHVDICGERMSGEDSQLRTSDYLRKSTWARWPMGTTKTLRYKDKTQVIPHSQNAFLELGHENGMLSAECPS